MKKEVFAIDQTTEMFCSVCEVEQNHSVETVTKLGQITKTVCNSCATVSTYSRGVKTSVTMSKTKTASPYDRTRKYRKGQSLMHAVFGQGEVTAVIEPQKMDVLFDDKTRRLIHGQT